MRRFQTFTGVCREMMLQRGVQVSHETSSVEHRQSKYLNNRAENSHQPTRQRERAMKKFSSPGGAQQFLSAFSGISPHFRTRHHLLHAQELTMPFAGGRLFPQS